MKKLSEARFLLVALTGIILTSGNVLFGACHGVGYAHLDPCWRWSINEGINKMRKTCLLQLNNMENHPEFKFSFDNPCEYEWMEIYYPKIFAGVKQMVAEGRWEPFGGQWADPLCDLLDGEAFVRQWLIGKRYLKEKFNFECKVGADLDNYSSWPGGNLPQIVKKCGIKYYTFARGLTHTNGKFFWWEANDGSKIFSHDTNYWYNSFGGGDGCSGTTPALKYYGAGNGGGGPDANQASDCGGADFGSRLIDFFADAVKEGVPEDTDLVAKGYCLSSNGIQATGLLTHRSYLKWYNRKCLCLLMEAEKFSFFAASLDCPEEEMIDTYVGAQKKSDKIFLGASKSGESGGFNYPQREFNEALKKYLFWQHHDNLPGNFTWDGVNTSHNDYVNVYNTYFNIRDRALTVIAGHVNTQGEGVPVLVFNSLSWTRTGVVEVPFSQFGNPENVDVEDGDGNAVPAQISLDGEKKLVFLARDIPATGYKEYRIIAIGEPSSFAATGLTVNIEDKIIENEYYRVEFDKNTGWWKRVYDKVNKREVLDSSGEGNCLGYAHKDGWPYGNGFDEWGVDFGGADSIEVIEFGPVRAKVRVKHGMIYQDTILTTGGKRIDCFTWSEDYKSGGGPAYLRVVFPLNIFGGIYTTEGPYGYSESPDEATEIEKPTLSWQDLSGLEYGVSILNDSKYGGDRDENKIKLSLISHPEFDQQEMLYSLYPHKGGWREGGTVRASYEINYPLRIKVATSHSGDLPKSHSFLAAGPSNIVVSVVKKHEDNNDLIIRFYETGGNKVKAKLVFGDKISKAWEEDMMEWNEISQELPIVDNTTLNIDIDYYEIKTLRIKK